MSRPKGKVQKRDESKYWLPKEVKFSSDLGNPNYRKATKVEFIDAEYGKFISSFKAVQDAKASTHPKAVRKRRELTNLEKYGCVNPSGNESIREKAKNTMLSRYGDFHALNIKEFKDKAANTLKKNYNVNHPMESVEIRKKQKNTFLNNYGVDNPMKNERVVSKLKSSNCEKYGVDNPSKNANIIEKILITKTNNKYHGSSKGEKELDAYISSLGFSTKKSYLGGEVPKEIDILIPELNIAFEYNGEYFHSELILKDKCVSYHLDKTKRCREKNIKLVHIFDSEWNSRKYQIKSFIRSMLGVNGRKIFARKCTIKSVSKKEAKEFLDTYHILGKVNHKVAYGLYLNNELLSLITLGSHHRNNNELILSRYVVKNNVTIPGGLSRLSKYAFNLHGELHTWIDLRFSTGENWEKSGWKVVSKLKPDYFYIDTKNSKVVSKQSRKKSSMNTPRGMTEHEHALKDGLYRVYDCGKLKLSYS